MDKHFEALKAQHDDLLENAPDGQEHNTETCILCKPELISESHERGEVENTYTQEDLDAAVAPIQAELDDLKAKLAAGELEDQIAVIQAEADKKVADLQTELENAELKASDAETNLANLVAYLEKVQTDQEAAELVATRRDDRIALIKENTSFSDETIDKRIDDWAQLDDEAFEAKLDEWKELSTASREGSEEVTSHETAMRTVRRDGVAQTSFISNIRNINKEASDAGRSLRTL